MSRVQVKQKSSIKTGLVTLSRILTQFLKSTVITVNLSRLAVDQRQNILLLRLGLKLPKSQGPMAKGWSRWKLLLSHIRSNQKSPIKTRLVTLSRIPTQISKSAAICAHQRNLSRPVVDLRLNCFGFDFALFASISVVIDAGFGVGNSVAVGC